ncbi:uncharacterized protein LOC128954055 [Oppia nitens]|uniref:uncharacterized protein LOC128954055 n=1 Tax=Oppia nitens TaxID=1686743 RepID=UPI0023DCCAE7|nr:uncharacterized protein LOC128954055 [Oppia nitens]
MFAMSLLIINLFCILCLTFVDQSKSNALICGQPIDSILSVIKTIDNYPKLWIFSGDNYYLVDHYVVDGYTTSNVSTIGSISSLNTSLVAPIDLAFVDNNRYHLINIKTDTEWILTNEWQLVDSKVGIKRPNGTLLEGLGKTLKYDLIYLANSRNKIVISSISFVICILMKKTTTKMTKNGDYEEIAFECMNPNETAVSDLDGQPITNAILTPRELHLIAGQHICPVRFDRLMDSTLWQPMCRLLDLDQLIACTPQTSVQAVIGGTKSKSDTKSLIYIILLIIAIIVVVSTNSSVGTSLGFDKSHSR